MCNCLQLQRTIGRYMGLLHASVMSAERGYACVYWHNVVLQGLAVSPYELADCTRKTQRV